MRLEEKRSNRPFGAWDKKNYDIILILNYLFCGYIIIIFFFLLIDRLILS